MSKTSLRTLVVGLVVATAGAAFAQSAGELSVSEVIIARSIEDHEPVEPGTSFSRGGALVCFIRAGNTTGEEKALFVSWEAGQGSAGSARGGVRLAVPPRARFRTYARTAVARPAGSYRCVVRDESGSVLGSADFSVTE